MEPATPPLPADRDKQSRTWGMLCHLTALCGLIGVPLGNIIGPLVVWLIKKNELPFVDSQGKESLNFQISMTIYMVAAGALAFLLMFILVGFLFIPVLIGLYIADLVLVIIASIKANAGIAYRYPLTIRLIH